MRPDKGQRRPVGPPSKKNRDVPEAIPPAASPATYRKKSPTQAPPLTPKNRVNPVKATAKQPATRPVERVAGNKTTVTKPVERVSGNKPAPDKTPRAGSVPREAVAPSTGKRTGVKNVPKAPVAGASVKTREAPTRGAVLPADTTLQRNYFHGTEGSISEFPELKELGFKLIDVLGDGHCGFYSVLVGRMMYGKGKVLADKRQALAGVMKLRCAAYTLVERFGKQIVTANIDPSSDPTPSDGADLMQLQFFTYELDEKEILESFYNPDNRRSYFRPLKNPKLHMYGEWGPFFCSILCRFPIVEYRYYEQITVEGNVEMNLSTFFVDGSKYDTQTKKLPCWMKHGIHAVESEPGTPIHYLVFQTSSNAKKSQHYMVLRPPGKFPEKLETPKGKKTPTTTAGPNAKKVVTPRDGEVATGDSSTGATNTAKPPGAVLGRDTNTTKPLDEGRPHPGATVGPGNPNTKEANPSVWRSVMNFLAATPAVLVAATGPKEVGGGADPAAGGVGVGSTTDPSTGAGHQTKGVVDNSVAVNDARARETTPGSGGTTTGTGVAAAPDTDRRESTRVGPKASAFVDNGGVVNDAAARESTPGNGRTGGTAYASAGAGPSADSTQAGGSTGGTDTASAGARPSTDSTPGSVGAGASNNTSASAVDGGMVVNDATAGGSTPGSGGSRDSPNASAGAGPTTDGAVGDTATGPDNDVSKTVRAAGVANATKTRSPTGAGISSQEGSGSKHDVDTDPRVQDDVGIPGHENKPKNPTVSGVAPSGDDNPDIPAVGAGGSPGGTPCSKVVDRDRVADGLGSPTEGSGSQSDDPSVSSGVDGGGAGGPPVNEAPPKNKNTEDKPQDVTTGGEVPIDGLGPYRNNSAGWKRLLNDASVAARRKKIAKTTMTGLMQSFASIGGKMYTGGSKSRDVCPDGGLAYGRVKYLPPGPKHSTDKYMVEEFTPTGTKPTRIVALDPKEAAKVFSHQYLALLKAVPNRWAGTPIGAPGDTDAPEHLRSSVDTKYTQGYKYHCLAYSLASALHYVGFPEEAFCVWEQAEIWAKLPMNEAIRAVLGFMAEVLPCIGGATRFMFLNARKRKRPLTIDDIIATKSPYPLLIVPRRDDGVINHALCVVDDLIFDSITTKALSLSRESFRWIFNERPITVHCALRFDQNLCPRKHKVWYTRECRSHFDPLHEIGMLSI